MTSYFRDVVRFHREILGQEFDGPPTLVDEKTFEFRLGFMEEELEEFWRSHGKGDLVGVADALADLVYVALGTADYYGIPFDEVWNEVHRSNMTKRPVVDAAESKRGDARDAAKGDGFEPPQLKKILGLES